jgi:hypothetical protein
MDYKRPLGSGFGQKVRGARIHINKQRLPLAPHF